MGNIKTNVKATNYELTSEIRSMIDQKIQGFDKFINLTENEELLVEVEVGKTTDHHQKGEVYRAEFNLTYNGQLYRADETSEDIRTSLDGAASAIEKQLRRGNKKSNDMFRKGGSKLKRLLRFGK